MPTQVLLNSASSGHSDVDLGDFYGQHTIHVQVSGNPHEAIVDFYGAHDSPGQYFLIGRYTRVADSGITYASSNVLKSDQVFRYVRASPTIVNDPPDEAFITATIASV